MKKQSYFVRASTGEVKGTVSVSMNKKNGFKYAFFVTFLLLVFVIAFSAYKISEMEKMLSDTADDCRRAEEAADMAIKAFDIYVSSGEETIAQSEDLVTKLIRQADEYDKQRAKDMIQTAKDIFAEK